MSDMSDDDGGVEFLGSTAALPPPEKKKKSVKTKVKMGSGKLPAAAAPSAKKPKQPKDSKKVTEKAASSGKSKAVKVVKAKAAGATTSSGSGGGKAKATPPLVKEKPSVGKDKPVVKKKKKKPAPAAVSVEPAVSPSTPQQRPAGMMSILDLCNNDDEETEDDEPLRRTPPHLSQLPRVGNGGSFDDGMSSVDEDDASSVVDSESGSIKTPPKTRAKKPKAPRAPRDHVDTGDDDDDDDDGADEGWSDHNRWYCNICKDGGELLCCDRCPRAFHMSCLGMKDKAIPDTEWFCKMCAECLDRRRVKKESREKARLMREAAKLERDATKRKMKQMKEDIIAQKNAEAIEHKAKRVLEMQDRILSRKKIKYKDKEEEKLGKLAEDLAQTVRTAKEKLEKLEKEDAALKKKEEAFNKKKKAGVEESAPEDESAAIKSDKPAPALCSLGDVSGEHVGELLTIWDCVNSFGSIIQVAPFTSDQLAAGLLHNEQSPLITEIHMCLLNLILEDREEDDYVSDDEASMDENERFRFEIQHAPATIGVPTSNLLNSTSWPSILYNLTMAVPRYSASMTGTLKDALNALNTKEYPELQLPQKLTLLKFLVSRAYATEKIRQMLGKHVSEGVHATKEFNRAALLDRKTAVEEEKKLREKQRVELAELVEKSKGSVKTWLKNDKKGLNGGADTASVEGDDADSKMELNGTPITSGTGSGSDSELDDLSEEALAKNEEDLEKLQTDGYISRHEYLSRKKQLENQREKLRRRAEERLKKQKALEQLERKRSAAKKGIQEGLVSKDPALLKIAIEKAKECDLPERILVSASHVLEILEAEAIREEEAETRKAKFNKTMREMYVRTEPLGKDKNGFRYWIFRGDKMHLYVEQPGNFDMKKHYYAVKGTQQVVLSTWFCYGSKAEVNALIRSLDEKHSGENQLRSALKENLDMITEQMPAAKPGLLLSDLANDNDAKKRAKGRANTDDGGVDDFLAWRNNRKTWKKKNHLETGLDAFREDLISVDVWLSKRLKELGSRWLDTGRNEWLKNVKTLDNVGEAAELLLALENEVMSFQLEALDQLAENGQSDRNGKQSTATNGEANHVNTSSKDPEKSEEEDDDDDDELEEVEATADEGAVLWPTTKSRDRWITEVKRAKTIATLSAALGSFVQRLDNIGLSEFAADDSVTTRRAKIEKEKQSRKERAVKKKQTEESEEAEVEVEDRHSVDDWDEDCYVCTEGGELLCCDGCPRVFHYPCVGLRRVPRGKTFCHFCDPSVKPVHPVVSSHGSVRAKAEPETVDSVEESYASDSDGSDSDVELAVDTGSLNAATKPHEDQWDVECGVCRLGGELLCCDGCPRAFHTNCIDLETVPDDEWFCDECNLQTCGSCKKNKIRLDSHVICGSEDGTKGCERVFHLKCAKLAAVPEDDWYCNKCRKTLSK